RRAPQECCDSGVEIEMRPARVGLIAITTLPRLFVRPLRWTPAPRTSTLAPCTCCLPRVTTAITLSGLPSALIIFGVTFRARQASGWGLGFGLGVGGVTGAGVTVTAEAVLSAGFVSRPPEPVAVAVFVCEPTVSERPVIAIVTV